MSRATTPKLVMVERCIDPVEQIDEAAHDLWGIAASLRAFNHSLSADHDEENADDVRNALVPLARRIDEIAALVSELHSKAVRA